MCLSNLITVQLRCLCVPLYQGSTSNRGRLRRINQILKGAQKRRCNPKADDSHVIKWHVDPAFAVHEKFKSHSGATVTLGTGAVTTGSTKQKLNPRSSTEVELTALDDYIAKMMWTTHFWTLKAIKSRTTSSTKTTRALSNWQKMEDLVSGNDRNI
jgi:hypothetical protein